MMSGCAVTKLTKEGQIKAGDTIKIIGKSERDSQITTVDVVINDHQEEVIINRKENKYFITDMVINGTSWAKEVFKID